MTVTITITVDPPDEALENRDPADWTAGYLAGLAVAHGLTVWHAGVRLWPIEQAEPVETCDGETVLADVAPLSVCAAEVPQEAAVAAEVARDQPGPSAGTLVVHDEVRSMLPAEDHPSTDADEAGPADDAGERLAVLPASKSHRSKQRKAAASRATVPPTGRLCSFCGCTTAECRDTPAGANCCPDCSNPLHRDRGAGRTGPR